MRKSLPAALCALSLALTLCTPAAALSQENLPLDLRDHWSSPYVITLLEAGTVTGYPDGRFRPNQTLTREEAVSLLYRLLPQSAYPDAATLAGISLYSDVAGLWSQDMIHVLLALGVLDNGETFRPTEPMTRGDMARYTAKVLTLLDRRDAAKTPPDSTTEPPTDGSKEPETPEAPAEGTGAPADGTETPATGNGNRQEEQTPTKTSTGTSAPATQAGSEVDTTEHTSPVGEDTQSNGNSSPDAQASTGEETSGESGTPPEGEPSDGQNGKSQGESDSGSDPAPSPDKITLAQVRQDLAGGTPLAFADSAAADGGLYIQFLYLRGVITGNDTGDYHPQDTLTRGQAAALLFRTSSLPLTATAFAPLPTYQVIDVPYLSQVHPVNAPVGCEATSLLMGLKAKGYAQDVDLRTFLDNLPRTTSDPAKGFVGSPYVADPTKKTRTTIYPAKLTEYGRQYGNVIDLTGASLPEIQREVLAGNPVVVYMTLYWEAPFYRWYNIEGQQQRLLSNNHALLLCGYNASTNAYYVADPYNIKNRYQDYEYWVDGATFEPLYLERCHAVAVE